MDPRVFLKQPLQFGKIIVYPPSVGDMSQDIFSSQYLKLLTLDQDDIRDELKKTGEKNFPTPLEYILTNSYHLPFFKELTEKAFYFFLKQPINFFYENKMIVVGNLEELVVKYQNPKDMPHLSEKNFAEFQNIIRLSVGYKEVKPPPPPDPNEDPRVRRIKEKARERDRIKAKKGSVGDKGLDFSSCLVAICLMGIGITPLNIGEMSYAAINPLISSYQRKEKYSLDIRSLLAGANSKKIKPKYWIENLEK